MRRTVFAIIIASMSLLAVHVHHSAELLAQKKTSSQKSAPAGNVLVTVNGSPITTSSLELWMIMHAIPESQRVALHDQALRMLAHEELVAQFLRSRKTEAPETEIDKLVRRWETLVAKEKHDPAEMRARLGYSESQLRETLSLMPRWKMYVNQVVTRDKLNEHFEMHREEFDGTRVRVSQILKKLPSEALEADVEAARKELSKLKTIIESGEIMFAEAAMQHSDAPSKSKGGDIGSFTFRGVMTKEITRTAFQLKPGQLSEPFRSPFGVHLIVVTDRQPGQLNLEDVRGVVLEQIGRNLWTETVTRLEAKADIKWTEKIGD